MIVKVYDVTAYGELMEEVISYDDVKTVVEDTDYEGAYFRIITNSELEATFHVDNGFVYQIIEIEE